MLVFIGLLIVTCMLQFKEEEAKNSQDNKQLHKNKQAYVEMQTQDPSSPVMNDSQAYMRPGNTSH